MNTSDISPVCATQIKINSRCLAKLINILLAKYIRQHNVQNLKYRNVTHQPRTLDFFKQTNCIFFLSIDTLINSKARIRILLIKNKITAFHGLEVSESKFRSEHKKKCYECKIGSLTPMHSTMIDGEIKKTVCNATDSIYRRRKKYFRLFKSLFRLIIENFNTFPCKMSITY